tara:strand:- start:3263 stop:4189 length:927 start_codon:yes stop_codon:yes gene_type:complete
MGTNINRQQILSRKQWSIHDGVGTAGATCTDYNCTSALFGGTDYVDTASNLALWNAFDITDPFTISFWIKPNWGDVPGTFSMLSIGDTTGAWNDHVFNIYFHNGNSAVRQNRLVIEFRSGADRVQAFWPLHSASATTGLPNTYLDPWSSAYPGYVNAKGFTNLTFTYNPTLSSAPSNERFRCLWNGNDIGASFANSNNPSSVDFPNSLAKTARLGARLVTNTSGMDGHLDEVSVINKVLSFSELIPLWNGTAALGSTDGTPNNLLSLPAATSNFLVAWYRFENNFVDSSTNTSPLTNNGVSFDQTIKA